MKITVRRDNDPFKRYWWVLLVAFGVAGAWIFSPLLSGAPGQVASNGGGDSEASLTGEGGLDSASNPNGARGGVIDLSMEGTGRKAKDGGAGMMSSLYQSPDSPAELTDSSAASSAGPNYADALKNVSEKKADPSGWGGAKAQKGFNVPKGALAGGLSGLAGGSSGGGGSFKGAFGSGVAKTGSAQARGLKDTGEQAPGGAPLLAALRSASRISQDAARQGSLDAARSGAARSFDRSGGGSSIGGGGGDAAGGAYAGLDSAPINLKANAPNLDSMKIEAPPAEFAGGMETGDEWKKQLAMMALTMVVGGMMGPTGGMMMMMVSQMAMNRNQEGQSGSNVGGQLGGRR